MKKILTVAALGVGLVLSMRAQEAGYFQQNLQGSPTHFRLSNEIDDKPVLFTLYIQDQTGTIVPLKKQMIEGKKVVTTNTPATYSVEPGFDSYFNFDKYNFKEAGATGPCIYRVDAEVIGGEKYQKTGTFCKSGSTRYYAIVRKTIEKNRSIGQEFVVGKR